MGNRDLKLSESVRNFKAPEVGEDFSLSEQEWFANKDLGEMRQEGEDKTKNSLERVRAEIDGLDDLEKGEPENADVAVGQSDGDKLRDEQPEVFFDKIKKGVKSFTHPSSDRLIKVGAGPAAIGLGAIGTSAAAGGLPFLAAMGAAGVVVGGGVFFTGEMIKQIRKRKVGELMSITPVYDKLSSDEDKQMLGELHLLGAKGMKRIRSAPKEKQRALMLAEVATSLKDMNKEVAGGSGAVQGIDNFFGETDVFSKQELDSLGVDYEEMVIPLWRKPVLEAADKLQKLLSGRWKNLTKSRREKPIYKIRFNREKLAEMTKSGKLDKVISDYKS